MKVRELTYFIESMAPVEAALGYDNPGLLIGSPDDEVKKVLVTLDVTSEVVDEAVEKGCDFILSHHPVIWAGIKKLTPDYPTADPVVKAIRAGIGVYAAHTNVDAMAGNMSWELLKDLGCDSAEPLFDNGFGAVGDVKEIKYRDLAAKVAKILDENVRTIGNLDETVKRVATVSGAAGDTEDVKQALSKSADVYITAELKHHVAVAAKSAGFKIIEVSHYASEFSFVKIFERLLDGVVETACAKSQKNPYNKEIL